MVKIYEEYEDDDFCIREISNFTTNDLSKHSALKESVKFILEGLFWFDYKNWTVNRSKRLDWQTSPVNVISREQSTLNGCFLLLLWSTARSSSSRSVSVKWTRGFTSHSLRYPTARNVARDTAGPRSGLTRKLFRYCSFAFCCFSCLLSLAFQNLLVRRERTIRHAVSRGRIFNLLFNSFLLRDSKELIGRVKSCNCVETYGGLHLHWQSCATSFSYQS